MDTVTITAEEVGGIYYEAVTSALDISTDAEVCSAGILAVAASIAMGAIVRSGKCSSESRECVCGSAECGAGSEGVGMA